MGFIAMRYILLDAEGKILKERFLSWTDADHYRNMMGRPDWKIGTIGFNGTMFSSKYLGQKKDYVSMTNLNK